jgi:cytochrome c553
MTRLLTGLALLALCAACARTPAPVVTPASPTFATTRQVMLGITIPTSDFLFQLGDKPPTSDAEWEKVVASALVLAESGQMLLTGTRNLDQPEWTQRAQALIDAAKLAAAAAQEKDVERVLDAGNTIYESCDGCHQKYMPARQGETAPTP